MSVTLKKPVITWEKTPESFIFDEPVDNTIQTPIAVALTDALHLAGRLPETALASTNIAVCATIDGKLTIKAPDWFYVPSVLPREPEREERRSYTPHIEGDVPAVVMEFLSETKGGEYSKDSEAPVGKWYYYEKILQVPVYVIFSPRKGQLEVHELQSQKYRQQKPDENNRYWIAEMGLFLGVWFGTKQNRTGNWLRWWDENGQMLPWLEEQVMQEQQQVIQERQRADEEQQRADQEQQRADQEQQRAEQEREAKEAALQGERAALRELALLKEKLNKAGIDPNEI